MFWILLVDSIGGFVFFFFFENPQNVFSPRCPFTALWWNLLHEILILMNRLDWKIPGFNPCFKCDVVSLYSDKYCLQ